MIGHLLARLARRLRWAVRFPDSVDVNDALPHVQEPRSRCGSSSRRHRHRVAGRQPQAGNTERQGHFRERSCDAKRAYDFHQRNFNAGSSIFIMRSNGGRGASNRNSFVPASGFAAPWFNSEAASPKRNKGRKFSVQRTTLEGAFSVPLLGRSASVTIRSLNDCCAFTTARRVVQ